MVLYCTSVSSSVLDAIISAQVGCEQYGLCDDVTLRGDSEEEEEEDEDIRALQVGQELAVALVVR